MNEFQFLVLPVLARNHILRNTEPKDLLQLSLSSQRMKEMIRRARIKTEKHVVNFEQPDPQIMSVFEGVDSDYASRVCYWTFYETHDYVGELKETSIGPLKFKQCLHESGVTEVFTHNAEYTLWKVLEHLLEVFPAPLDLHLNVNHIHNVYYLCELPFIKKCRKLSVAEDGFYGMDEFQIESILESVQVEKELDDYSELKHSICFNNICHTEIVYINCAENMYLPHLLSLHFKHAQFNAHILKREDIVKFVKRWLGGGHPELHSVNFSWEENMRFDDVFSQNLTLVPWDPKRRAPTFIHFDLWDRVERPIDCRMGMDVIRSDGTMASLVFHEHEYDRIYFYVWHSRCPVHDKCRSLGKQSHDAAVELIGQMRVLEQQGYDAHRELHFIKLSKLDLRDERCFHHMDIIKFTVHISLRKLAWQMVELRRELRKWTQFLA